MKRSIAERVLAALLITPFSAKAAAALFDGQTYSTKFGKLEFVNSAGRVALPASILKLNGVALLKATIPMDENDYRPSFMPLDYLVTPSSSDFVPRHTNSPPGNAAVYRMVIGEGEDGNCIRQFILLDFAGDKPYVSNRFGCNPGGQYCLNIERVKWENGNAQIYLEGPTRYIYHVGHQIIDADE